MTSPFHVFSVLTVIFPFKNLPHSHPQAKVTDAAVKNGLSTNGVSLKVEKKGNFTFEYCINGNAPVTTLNTAAKIADKDIKLKYKHAAKSGAASVEAEVAVDDKHTATVVYDLTNYTADYKRATLKWKYAHSDELTIEPSVNLADNKPVLSATYKIDGDNSLKATYTHSKDDLALELTNKKLIGGDLKVVVNSNVKEIAPKFKITAERTIDL